MHGARAILLSLASLTSSRPIKLVPRRSVFLAAGGALLGLLPTMDRAAARQDAARARFSEIDVERINVVEPDGTRRLVLANTARIPNAVVNGMTFGSRQGSGQAGVIFYNQEGDECGGLIFAGRREEGQVVAGAGLMFDQFEQDQIIGIQYGDDGGERRARLAVWSRPDEPISDLVARANAIEAMADGPAKEDARRRLEQGAGAARLWVGVSPERAAAIGLADEQGRERLRLAVGADGAAAIEFLDEEGRVVSRLPGTDGQPPPTRGTATPAA